MMTRNLKKWMLFLFAGVLCACMLAAGFTVSFAAEGEEEDTTKLTVYAEDAVSMERHEFTGNAVAKDVQYSTVYNGNGGVRITAPGYDGVWALFDDETYAKDAQRDKVVSFTMAAGNMVGVLKFPEAIDPQLYPKMTVYAMYKGVDNTPVNTYFYGYDSAKRSENAYSENLTADNAAKVVSTSMDNTDLAFTVNTADFTNADGMTEGLLVTRDTVGDQKWSVMIAYVRFETEEAEDFYMQAGDMKLEKNSAITANELTGYLSFNVKTEEQEALEPGATGSGRVYGNNGIPGFNVPSDNVTRITRSTSDEAITVLRLSRPVNAQAYSYMVIEAVMQTWNQTGPVTTYFFNSSATVLSESTAVASVEVPALRNYAIQLKLETALFADDDGFVRTITFAKDAVGTPSNPQTVGQADTYFGRILFKATTPTSYLDDYVLTDATERSMTVSGTGAEFVADFPAANDTDGKGAYDNSQALMITDDARISFLKPMVVATGGEGGVSLGNMRLRLYIPAEGGATSIAFAADEAEASLTVTDGVQGRWFDVELTTADFETLAEGIIGSINITADGTFYLGGITVDEVLRVISDSDEHHAVSDLETLLPIGEGVTYTQAAYDAPAESYNVPIFTLKDMHSVYAYKFRMTVADFSKSFNFYYTLRGASANSDNAVWFWFNKDGMNMLGNSTLYPYPADVTAGTPFLVEVGTVPYFVEGNEYGYHAYIKVNDELITEANIDFGDVTYGSWLGAYSHLSEEGSSVTIAPVNADAAQPELFTVTTSTGETLFAPAESGKRENIDQIVINKAINLEGATYTMAVTQGTSILAMDEDGWLTVGTKTGDVVIEVKAETSIGTFTKTLTLRVANTFTVSFDGKKVTVEEGQKVERPEDPTMEGYTFVGWFLDEACTQAFDFNTPVTEDIVLYSGWTQGSADTGSTGCSGSAYGASAAVAMAAVVVAVLLLKRKGAAK
mgnify:CR=1 FL=1